MSRETSLNHQIKVRCCGAVKPIPGKGSPVRIAQCNFCGAAATTVVRRNGDIEIKVTPPDDACFGRSNVTRLKRKK